MNQIKSYTLFLFCSFFFLISLHAASLTNEWANAVLDYKTKNYESALSHFKKILELDTNNVQALIGMAGTYQHLHDFNQAETNLNRAVQLSSNNIILSAAYLCRGSLHQEMTNWDQAIDDFSKAIQFNPASSEAYVNRAYALLNKNQINAAIIDCNMAIMLNPDSAETYDFRGRAFGQAGKYDQSIADFSKAIELETNNAILYYSRGQAFGSKDDYTNAIGDFSKALELDLGNTQFNAEIYASRGFARSKLYDYTGGIEDCKMGVQLNRNCFLALNNLAWLMSIAPDSKLRDGNKAVEYAKKACDLSRWGNAYSLGTLAVAYAEAGNFDEAVKWERKCIILGLQDKDMKQALKELDLFEQGKPYHADK